MTESSVHSAIQRFAVFTGLFNNCLLIYLVLWKSAAKIGNYKYLMVYISLFEIIYAIIDGLTAPEIYSKDSVNLLIMRVDRALLPVEFLQFSNVIFCDMFGMSMAIFAVHFIYRYLVLSRKQWFRKRDGQLICAIFLFSFLFGIVWSFAVWFTMKPFVEADQFLMEHFLPPRHLKFDQIAYIGLYYYPRDALGNEFVYWNSFVGMIIQGSFIMVSFVLIFYFGFKCYSQTKFLVNQSLQSSSFENLQSQLFYALVFQTMIPVLLMHIPSSIVYTAALINESTELYGSLLSTSICLYPALDPLPNFFIIKSYRNAIIGFFKYLIRKIRCCRGPKVSTISSTNPHVSNITRISTM